MTKQIPLSQGKVALVDDADYEWLNQYKWNVDVRGKYLYASRHLPGTRKNIRMHKFIMNTPSGMEIDHIDGDGLNNQRNNLRIVTRSQNQWNRRVQSSKTGFKGVIWHSGKQRWRARISVMGKRISRGAFRNPEDAARKYNELAIQYHGEYARLNDL